MFNLPDFLISVVYYGWIAFLAISGVRYLLKNREWITYYRNINIGLYIYILPVIALIIWVFMGLYNLNPVIFGASWIRSVGHLLGKDLNSTNINVVGTNIPVFGIILCLLLMVQLPSWAHAEERLFREGTQNWFDGSIRSVGFGLVHMIVGVPFGAALALTFAGLLFTYMYFKGGIALSTQTHFQYNLALFSILLVGAVLVTF